MSTMTTAAVPSTDGTPIGYHRLGDGPGLVLLHGIMESAHSHIELAEALADAFTVYLPDRRGRGRSGPYGAGHRLEQEVDDLAVVLAATGAKQVFGISAGAIVTLQAALTLPTIDKVAIFEPPLFDDATVPTAILTRYDRELAAGRMAAALVTAMKGAQMGPAVFHALPRRLLEWLTTMAMRQDDKKTVDGYVPMRALAPTLHHDLRFVADASGTLQEQLGTLPTEVLLLGGGKSPAYLRRALDALEQTLPRVSRIDFPGLHHGATGNRNRGGRPERVAQELRRFFAPTTATSQAPAD